MLIARDIADLVTIVPDPESTLPTGLTLRDIGLILTAGPVNAGATTMPVVVSGIPGVPVGAPGGPNRVITPEQELQFDFPASFFRQFDSSVTWPVEDRHAPESPSTVEILDESPREPFISGLTGPGVSNGRRVFALGEEIGAILPTGAPNNDPAQNLVVTVNFDGRRLVNGVAPGFDLAVANWQLVGIVLEENEDGELVPVPGSISEIFEPGYILSAVEGVAAGVDGDNSVRFLVRGSKTGQT
jgi:hypothetical protein